MVAQSVISSGCLSLPIPPKLHLSNSRNSNPPTTDARTKKGQSIALRQCPNRLALHQIDWLLGSGATAPNAWGWSKPVQRNRGNGRARERSPRGFGERTRTAGALAFFLRSSCSCWCDPRRDRREEHASHTNTIGASLTLRPCWFWLPDRPSAHSQLWHHTS